jgi:hypothetical protein
MAGMLKPPPVYVSLGPSRLACVAILLNAVGTSGVLVAAQLSWFVLVGALCAIVGWAAFAVRQVGLRRGSTSVRALCLKGDDSVVIDFADGRSIAGALRTSSSVGARVTTLVWRPEGAFCSRAVLILPDMLPADTFRRLRVLMRYGRSDETEGAPASHA